MPNQTPKEESWKIRFIEKWCVKRLAEPIRWVRAIFRDDTDQIEQIMAFIESEITLAVQTERERELEALTKMWNTYGGSMLLTHISELQTLLTPPSN